MANCTVCGKAVGCSCKLRRASDGKMMCSNCLPKYELMLKAKKK
jgi:hypothetical protein